MILCCPYKYTEMRSNIIQFTHQQCNLFQEFNLVASAYVERNPVRAAMVRCAEQYRWSSAAAHCGQRADVLLNTGSDWGRKFLAVKEWSAWLAEGDDDEALNTVRRNIDKGLPCGSDAFIAQLGQQAGRLLGYRPQGRPAKDQD